MNARRNIRSEQRWALTLLGAVRQKLEAEYASAGKEDRFTQLEQFLPGADAETTYADAAARLGMPEGTVKSDVHRLKKRYRDLVREEIANTTDSLNATSSWVGATYVSTRLANGIRYAVVTNAVPTRLFRLIRP